MTALLLQHSQTLQWVLHLRCSDKKKNSLHCLEFRGFPQKNRLGLVGLCFIKKKTSFYCNEVWVGFCRTGGQTKYGIDTLLPGTSTFRMKYTSSKSLYTASSCLSLIVFVITFLESRIYKDMNQKPASKMSMSRLQTHFRNLALGNPTYRQGHGWRQTG